MKAHYDDETIDALVAASLRPLKHEPTDERIETIFSDQAKLSKEGDEVFESVRGNLVLFLSGTVKAITIPSLEPEQLNYAAMNRENADNEFDEDMQREIEEARRKALDELEEEARDDNAEIEGEDD